MSELIEVRESTIQGLGVFARKRIRKGKRILEYTGERITPEEADRRYDDESMDRHHTFLFAIDEKTCIDGSVGENPAKYINHSCDPNCEAIDEDGRIFIEALRDIEAGEELFYDYAYERESASEDESIYPCFCGSKKCRGSILAPQTKVD